MTLPANKITLSAAVMTEGYTLTSDFVGDISTPLGAAAGNIAGLGDLTGADTLTGGGGDNLLNGSSGNDSLVGLEGADTLDGGAGDDTYIIDNLGDVVIDTAGIDTVILMKDGLTVTGDVEIIRLGGTAHKLTGSAGDTVLEGGAGYDRYRINGASVEIEDFLGHDTLDASEGTGHDDLDLSGDTDSVIEGETCHIGGSGSTVSPLDVQFQRDLTGSFGDDIATVRGLVPRASSCCSPMRPSMSRAMVRRRGSRLGRWRAGRGLPDLCRGGRL